MFTGTQFTGSLPPNATQRWFTFNWPAEWQVAWTVVPTDPISGQAQVDCSVAIQRTSTPDCTYWLTISNLTPATITFEARYAVLNN